MGEATPLTPEDRAILALEEGPVAGHTCKVVVLGSGAPTVEEVRQRFAARLGEAPPLTRRLGGTPDAPAWVPEPDFDLDRHVVTAQEGEVDAEGLRGAVARIFAEKLDRSRPLWRLDVIGLPGGAGALVWRIHHAVADGTTAMRFARLLLWDDPSEPAGHPSHHAPAGEDDARRRSHLAGFLGREFSRSAGPSPFDGRIGSTRAVAFAAAPLRDLHDAAKGLCGATVNDAVLTCIAGGLRQWIVAHHDRLGEVRVRVPVSLHEQGDHAGNRDSFFTLGLPVAEEDPVARLRAVREATAKRKAEHDAEEMDAVLRELGSASPRLRALAERLEASPRSFALNVSNVPGPPGPVAVGGATVERLHSIAEIGERHGLRIAVVSYAGELRFGLCADPGVVDGLDAVVSGIQREAAALVAAA